MSPPSQGSVSGQNGSSPVTSIIADPGSSGSSGSLEETTGKRIACIECRQQKVRCDGHEKWPGPCSRCAKRKAECKMEPNFKRTSKRQKMIEMEREMEDLRRRTQVVQNAHLSESNPTSPSLSGYNPYTQQMNQQVHPHPQQVNPHPQQVNPHPQQVNPHPQQINHPQQVNPQQVNPQPQQSLLPNHRLLPSPIYFPQRNEPSVPIQRPEWVVNDWTCSPKTIDGFTLQSDTIKNLFKEFVEKYHPFLPVVDVSRGPEKIYSLCPSLFWTIMAVASRRYDKDGELMMKLTPLLNSCLAEITLSPVTRYGSIDQSVTQGRAGIKRTADQANDPDHATTSSSTFQSDYDPSKTNTVLNLASVYSVQAFLICTMWPPLTSTISADSSWNSAGIAMFNSIRVGLHCPGYARDFGRIKQDNAIYPKITEQVRTWICCNIVSQSVAGMFGFPSFTSFDATVLSACRVDSGIDIPESIRLMMMIQRLENEIEKGLNSNLKDPLGLSELSERLSIIQMMAQKLDELELTLASSHEFDESRRFMFLAARVHLMTYYFLDNDGLTSFQQQRGLVQAYNAALALLDHCDQVCRRDKDFIRYLPQVYVELLWQASSIVNKIYHSQYSQYVDSYAGRALYIATVQHVAKASILKHDMSYRATEIMQQIWQVYDALIDKPDPHGPTVGAKVSIRTRMAASVFFDCLWTMREQCEIRSVAPAVLNQRTTSTPDSIDESITGGAGNNFISTINGLNSTNPSVSSTPTPPLSQHSPIQKIIYPNQRAAPPATALPISSIPTNIHQPIPSNVQIAPTPTTTTTSASMGYSRPISANSSSIRSDPPISPSLGNSDISERIGPMTLTPTTTTNSSTPIPNNVIIPTVSNTPNPNAQQQPGGGFDWDVDLVWKDVDSMMNDFGFRVEEVASFM